MSLIIARTSFLPSRLDACFLLLFKLCANECFADAGLFDCIVNVDDVQVAATVQNDTNSFDFDEEMYEIEGEEEESWTNDHDHVHDEAEHAEWFDEDNAVWDVHHDDKDSHSTNPFGVSLDDCTQIFVDHVSNGQATSSIARSSNAVHQISLEPNEIGCFQILSSAAPGNLSPEEVTVKLSIRNSIYGRYEITQIPLDHDGQMYRGFAWQGDADGIVSPSNQSCCTRLPNKFSIVTLVLLRSHWR